MTTISAAVTALAAVVRNGGDVDSNRATNGTAVIVTIAAAIMTTQIATVIATAVMVEIPATAAATISSIAIVAAVVAVIAATVMAKKSNTI